MAVLLYLMSVCWMSLYSMFVERKVCCSTLFTNLVGWHAVAVSFPPSDVILAQLACPLSDAMFHLNSGRINLSLYKHWFNLYRIILFSVILRCAENISAVCHSIEWRGAVLRPWAKKGIIFFTFHLQVQEGFKYWRKHSYNSVFSPADLSHS